MASQQKGSTNKRTLTMVAVAAVIGAVAYYGSQSPPVEDEAAGTIAPAKRYRGEQISSEDIQLGDQGVQRLMQTDAFARLQNDPDFAALVRDPAFAKLAGDPAFAKLASDPAFARLVNDPSLSASFGAER
jgi:hypothetical protein